MSLQGMLFEVMPARCVQSDASSAFSGTGCSITRRFTSAMLFGCVLIWKLAYDRVSKSCRGMRLHPLLVVYNGSK